MSRNSMQVCLPRDYLTAECGLCLENSPRLFPCNHNFCLTCLRHILDSSQSCPTCRSPTNIPPGGLDGLTNGFNWKIRTEDVPPKFNMSWIPKFEGNCARTEKKERRVHERVCTSHPEQALRFYCTVCQSAICRDCKLTSHERHPAIDLHQKSAEVKTLTPLILDISQNDLQPKMQQMLQAAENHRKGVAEERKRIMETIERRGERLKEVIDQAMSRAKEQLEKETKDVDRLVASAVDSMNEGLGTFESLTDHAQGVVDKGCDADIVELLPQVEKFLMNACQQGMEEFEIVEKDTTQSSPGTYSVTQDGVLCCFLTDSWKKTVQLSESTSTEQCPHCSFKYSDRAITCPKHCFTSTPKPVRKNWFGLKAKKPDNNNRPQLHCQTCGEKYDATFEFCPSCGMSSSQDALSAIKTIIPQYIGHVSQLHLSKEEDSYKGSSVTRSGKRGQQGRVQTLSPPTTSASEAREIFNIIRTVLKLLQDSQ